MNLHQTEISKDLENKKLHVSRKFSAPVDLVWRTWTEAELLDQWWAPRPYQAKTKEMNFSEGGHWLYYMESPEGDKHWCRADYISISEEDFYTAKDAFCDEDGKVNEDHPRMLWKNTFIDQSNETLVQVQISFTKVEEIEKIIEMGFKEGFTAAVGNLDELLQKLNS
ncbi:Uncharacterized conserved protein YndB, AHSA1/START domain [Reichenbachiella faecimaris]|uniref:Uncharacterized conserved protein YndB, AHSA1/START domain n=1 Tax=Reichenbachiella faecimaris TaxID=692418 RepID=A0A1W2G882_REIFA|nr:SRPBCC domain-containing protein [Reichenbachiella faecimaris]SMD32877.1 Uncharacterized conserved protein YndB, AHSA1/START domain [Reichenbachiella faecimaris]